MKPILFNTAMVQAILDGRKTVTRRVVKPQPTTVHGGKKGCFPLAFYFDCSHWVKPPYQVGDVLWVRETWAKIEDFENNFGFDIDDGLKYLFKCDDNGKAHNSVDASVKRWRPSIHMPKEAARIFLKVTDVRVERLQDITEVQVVKEGVDPYDDNCCDENWKPTFYDPDSGGTPQLKKRVRGIVEFHHQEKRP